MKKTATLLILIIFACMFFCSCADSLYLDNDSTGQHDQIGAIPDNNKLQKVNNSLYFAMENENYLVAELRQISYNANESQAYAVIKELIKGPDDDTLMQLINPNTQILSVTTNNDYVYLSLSKDVLDVPAAVDGWQFDQRTIETVYMQRRMAIYSIVNTLTEISGITYVQIFIDINSDETAEKITRGEAGFNGDGNEGDKLDVLSRDHDYILTPINTVRLMFELINKNQPERLYSLIAPLTDGVPVSYSEFYEMFISSNVIFGSYYVDPELSVSNYGNSFVIKVDYLLKNTVNNNVVQYSNVPVNVYRNGNIYLIDMNFIKKVLKG